MVQSADVNPTKHITFDPNLPVSERDTRGYSTKRPDPLTQEEIDVVAQTPDEIDEGIRSESKISQNNTILRKAANTTHGNPLSRGAIILAANEELIKAGCTDPKLRQSVEDARAKLRAAQKPLGSSAMDAARLKAAAAKAAREAAAAVKVP